MLLFLLFCTKNVRMVPQNVREHEAEDVVALPPTIIPSGMPTPRYRRRREQHGEDANPRFDGDMGLGPGDANPPLPATLWVTR